MVEDKPGNGVAAKAAGHGDMRASHEDRDRVVEALRVAAGDGRLTPEELDERLEKALSARTYAELAVLTTDLPAASGSPVPAVPAERPAARDLVKIQVGSGQAQRAGRWVVPREMQVQVTSGHVKLDFTQALFSEPELKLAADVRSGHLLIITRPGIVVDADEVAVRSGHVTVRAPWAASVPTELHITISGKCRSGHIAARPPRRSFWQWLRRAPRAYAVYYQGEDITAPPSPRGIAP